MPPGVEGPAGALVAPNWKGEAPAAGVVAAGVVEPKGLAAPPPNELAGAIEGAEPKSGALLVDEDPKAKGEGAGGAADAAGAPKSPPLGAADPKTGGADDVVDPKAKGEAAAGG